MNLYHLYALISIILFFYCPYSNCKVSLGLLDRIAVSTDWGKVGEFCFTIPEGQRGIVESEVVVSDTGHKLILVTATEEKIVLSNTSLTSYNPERLSSRRLLAEDFISLKTTNIANRLYNQFIQHARHLLNMDSLQQSVADLSRNKLSRELAARSKIHLSQNDSSKIVPKPLIENEFTSDINEKSNDRLNALHDEKPVHTESASHLSSKNHGKHSNDLDEQLPTQHTTGKTHGTIHPSVPVDNPEVEKVPVVVISPSLTALETATSVCTAFEELARVTESLRNMGKLTAYHLVLWVEPHVNMQRVSAIITRCNLTPTVEYRIQFKNPGNFLKTHFSCEDQGLLQMYAVATCVCILFVYPLHRLWSSVVHPRKEFPGFILTLSDNTLINVIFLSIISFGVSIMLTFLHFLVYAFDGSGLSVLSFIASLAELIFTVAAASAMVSLCLGDNVTDNLNVQDNRGNPFQTIENNDTLPNLFMSNSLGLSDNLLGLLRSLGHFVYALVQKLSIVCVQPSWVLTILTISLFIVTMVASLRFPAPQDPLMPNWFIYNVSAIVGAQNFLLFFPIAFYLASRIQFSFLFIRGIILLRFSTKYIPPVDKSSANHIISPTFLSLSCAIWGIFLPSLALVQQPWIQSYQHARLGAVLIMHFYICLLLAFQTKRFHLFHYENPHNKENEGHHKNQSLWEHQRLVSTNGYQNTTIVGSTVEQPIFPAPAWDKDDDDEEEPELVDVSAASQGIPSVFGYSTIN